MVLTIPALPAGKFFDGICQKQLLPYLTLSVTESQSVEAAMPVKVYYFFLFSDK